MLAHDQVAADFRDLPSLQDAAGLSVELRLRTGWPLPNILVDLERRRTTSSFTATWCDGPVGFWAMNLSSGTQEPDLSGKGSTGTYKGPAPTPVAMPNGDQAASFTAVRTPARSDRTDCFGYLVAPS